MSTEDLNSGNNILTLDRSRIASDLPAIEKIETYWHQVRGSRLVPSRCEIDPRGLEGVLKHAFILERITGGLARFRIAGSHLGTLSGLELRHMPISALFLPESREILADALAAAFDEPATLRMRIASPGGFGRERLEGELVLLPLRSDLGDIDRVLGGIVLDGKVGRTPRRIEILSQSRQSLVGFAGPRHTPTIARNDRQRATPKPPVKEVAPRKPMQTAKRGVERRRQSNGDTSPLRLVIDNT